MAELCKASRYSVPWKDTLIITNQGHQQWSDKDSISLSSLACLLQTKAVDRTGSPKAGFINSFKHGGLYIWNFRKMVMTTLYMRQQERHRCIERTFGLCGRGRGWDDLGEWHLNMYNIMQETNRQSRSEAGYRMLGAGARWWPREMIWGGRWEGGSWLGTHVHPWWIHVNVCQNQYSIVK